MSEHIPQTRLSQFGRPGAAPTPDEEAHLLQCAPCRTEFEDARSLLGFFATLPLLTPSATFARNTVAAFEVAWQKRRSRQIAKALLAGSGLSVAAIAALVFALPITALNTAGHLLAQGAQRLRLVTQVVHGVTHLSPVATLPLLVALVIVCFATTLLLERSVRLGRRTT